MSVPKPPVALMDICSVIFNNTLYTYSAGAFQSLALVPGAQWKTLSQGVPVTGAVCVGSTPVAPREPGFFVVGGKGPADYSGLQKFTYSTGKWETLNAVSSVTKERLGHGAVYINSTDTILVYAGSQDGSQAESTTTFTIGASAPHDVSSFASTTPAFNPMLLTWSSTQAALIGGSTMNSKVMLFSPTDGGWKESGASLAAPLAKDATVMKAAIIEGDDGSKSLYTFDASQSPNLVTRTVLVNGQGQPVQNSPALTARSAGLGVEQFAEKDESRRVKRLTSDQWPQYNSTYAPKVTRTNFAVAEGTNGQIVMAGGNAEDPLCIFDGRENKWENAATYFAEQQVFAQSASTSSAAISTSTSSASASTSSSSVTPTTTLAVSASTTSSASSQSTTPAGSIVGAPASSSSSSSSNTSPTTILAAVLGTTACVLLLLGLLYCLLRRKKQRQNFVEAGHNRRASGTSSSEKGGIAYTKDNFPRSPTAGTFRGHQQQESQASFSSMAILMGKVNQQNQSQNQNQIQNQTLKQGGIERQPSKESRRSSASSILNTAFKKSISKPMPQAQNANPFADPPPMVQSRDEKGVSFRGDVVEPRPRAARPDMPEGPRRSSGWNRYWSGGSTLNILGFGSGAGASKRTTVDSEASSHYSNQAHRITQDSATVPHLAVNRGVPPPLEPKPGFCRVNSGSPTIAQYSSHIKEGMAGTIERPMSSQSGSSGYSSGIPASVHEAWDPTAGNSKPWGADRAPSSAYNNNAYMSIYNTPLAPASASTSSKSHPSGVSTQPQLAMASTSSDMSWLNLGENSRRA